MFKTILMVLTVIITASAISFAATIHVPADYPTIQEAIDAAVNGDTVLVSSGVYAENINFLGKAITVISSDGPKTTKIDGGRSAIPNLGSGVTFESGEGPDSVLEGFTIFNGTGTYTEFQWDSSGGGIHCTGSSPTLVGNIIADNSVEWDGGGMHCVSGSPTLFECTFSNNKAYAYYSYGHGGGGMRTECGTPKLYDCTFEDNETYWEGGGFLNSGGDAVVVRCVFDGNVAIGGGGIYSEDGDMWGEDCTFTDNYGFLGGAMSHSKGNWYLKDCVFDENRGDSGAGIFNWHGCLMLHDCVFSGNVADFSAGGINIDEGIVTLVRCSFQENSADACGGIYNKGNLTLINCVLTNNSAKVNGGALNNYGRIKATLTNCTFSNNSSQDVGAVLNESQSVASMVNCIFWGDTPDEIRNSTGSYSVVSHSCIQGGWPGTGNIDTDPLFVDAANGDYHINYTSPCRDAGDNSAVTGPTDFEGDPRIAYGTVDMGADEFYTHLYVTGDKTPGGAIQGKFVGLPGTTPVGLFIGSGILPSPMNTMWGEYWLQAPWIMLGPLGAIPANGVMVLPTTLPPGMTVPVDIPMQALIGLNADSLTNLCVLEVR